MTTDHHRSPAQGIYRRVTVRMYGDEKFMRLSPLQPSGQALWLYLLTGPHTGQIPGVFVAGRAALAETLGWEPEAFAKAFDEVIGEGLVEFDQKTRMWFIPNAINHNAPPNPNVVKSWRMHWLLLPECGLRDRIHTQLLAELTEVSEAFGKAFKESCGKAFEKPWRKAFEKPSPKHMAKQEQEQEKEKRPKAPSALSRKRRQEDGVPNCPQTELIALFAETVPEMPHPRPEGWAGRRADAMLARWRWVMTAKRETGERYATTAPEGIEWFGKFFKRVAESDFLTARNGKWDKCDLTWLLNEDNFMKVVEGKYANAGAAA